MSLSVCVLLCDCVCVFVGLAIYTELNSGVSEGTKNRHIFYRIKFQRMRNEKKKDKKLADYLTEYG